MKHTHQTFHSVLIILTFAVFSAISSIGNSAEVSTPPYILKKLKYASDASLNKSIQEEVKIANQMKLKPFVYFYADWCPHCRAISIHIGNPKMRDALKGTYLITIDIDIWDGKIIDSKFPLRGVPTFYEVSTVGLPTGKKITSAAWKEDIPDNMAPALKKFFAIH
jgi:thiol-disulfide isomerase/thioredoxin